MKNGMPAWLRLALIALAAGLLLGFTNELTAPIIAAQTEAQAPEARKAALPQAESFEALTVAAEAGLDSCYAGMRGGAVVGYVGQATVKGYGGPIEVLVGIDSQGVITGISAGGPNFAETTGLGAKVRDAAFTDQFKGQKGPLALGGNSGATVSADAASGATASADAASGATAETPLSSEASGNVDAITGATISSRAVVNAVNAVYTYVQTLLQK